MPCVRAMAMASRTEGSRYAVTGDGAVVVERDHGEIHRGSPLYSSKGPATSSAPTRMTFLRSGDEIIRRPCEFPQVAQSLLAWHVVGSQGR